MPKSKLTWENIANFAIVLIVACGLLVMILSATHLDQGEYQLLMLLGANSAILGTMLIKERKELLSARAQEA